MTNLGTAFEAAGGFVGVRSSPHLRQRQFVTAVLLMVVDVLIFAIAAMIFRPSQSVPHLLLLPEPPVLGTPIDLFYFLSLVFVGIRYARGDYTRRRLFWDQARATTLSLLLAATPCFVIVALLPMQYSFWAEAGTWGFLLVAIPVVRQGARIFLDRLGLWRVPTALIASCSRYEDVLSTINNTLTLGCRIDWLALDDTEQKNRYHEDLTVLSASDAKVLANRLHREGCIQAIVATDDMQSQSFADLVQRLMEVDIGVSFIPSFHRLPLGGVTISYFFGNDILLFQVRNNLQGLLARFAKRTFDIIGSLAALVLLLPLFAAIAIAIRQYDGGPVIYSQKRTGRNGEQFNCLKFRTMAVNADERLRQWEEENPELYAEFQKTFKLVNDPRITKPGNWLRKTSLDELPQLLNVLRGDMSLVGPRPVLEQELVEFYGAAAKLYKRVRPGLTGLWQVRGRSDTSYEQRVILDEWYILNWSFWYDVVILIQTVWVVLAAKGAY